MLKARESALKGARGPHMVSRGTPGEGGGVQRVGREGGLVGEREGEWGGWGRIGGGVLRGSWPRPA